MRRQHSTNQNVKRLCKDDLPVMRASVICLGFSEVTAFALSMSVSFLWCAAVYLIYNDTVKQLFRQTLSFCVVIQKYVYNVMSMKYSASIYSYMPLYVLCMSSQYILYSIPSNDIKHQDDVISKHRLLTLATIDKIKRVGLCKKSIQRTEAKVK